MTQKITLSTGESRGFRRGLAVFLIAAAAFYGLTATPAEASPPRETRPHVRHNHVPRAPRVPRADLQIRQALSLAIDRRAIEDHVASGDADQMAREAFVTMLTGNVLQNELQELAELVGEFDEFGVTFACCDNKAFNNGSLFDDTFYGFPPPKPFEDRRIRVTGSTGPFGQPKYFDPVDPR